MSITGVNEILKYNYSVRKTLAILKRVGPIEKDTDLKLFSPLLTHENRDVRVEVVKNIGKLSGKNVEGCLLEHFKKEKDTLVKRECISSLGRQRNPDLIDFFIETLNSVDPKIVLQVIRSLLVFKKDPKVIKALNSIRLHPNEMIQDLLDVELSSSPIRTKKDHVSVDPKLKNVTVHGDVLKVLKVIKNECFHLTFTSPPYYNARDYSLYSSYKEYLDFLRKVFQETYRLTKNGRFLIVNTSPIIIPRVSRKHSSKRYPIPFDVHNFLVKDGWEFIDDIVWKKPEVTVKNRIGGFMQHKKPLGYKPNAVTEYLMVYRKKSRDLIDWNMKQYDQSIINKSKLSDSFETTNVWEIDPTFDKTHSAVFPKKLCENIINYYSYFGDLVFDPFGGSGTFGQVALEKGRNFFMTELNEKYYLRIQERLSLIKEDKLFFKLKDFKKWIQQEN